MDDKKRAALLKSWEEFEENLPNERIIRKGGVFGEDIILKKQIINGMLVFLVPLDVPLFGEEVP